MQFIAGDDIVISADDFIDEHLFFASESFEFNGSIKGDIIGVCKVI